MWEFDGAKIKHQYFQECTNYIFIIIFDLYVGVTDGNWFLMSCHKCDCAVYVCVRMYVCVCYNLQAAA